MQCVSVRIVANCEVRRNSPQDCPYFWHQLQVQGVPQTILNLNNMLEGLVGIMESCYAHGYILLQEKHTD